jgi:hypothetical protein
MKINWAKKLKNVKLQINAFFVIIFLFLLMNTNAQSIEFLETKLIQLQNNYKIQTASLDSLKNILNRSVKQIDSEKRKTNLDEDKVKKLMAASVTISNRIDKKQETIDKAENELEEIKKLLDKKYTSLIDSLSQLENSKNFMGSKEQLRTQILKLTEKKVLVAPAIFSLSFNPEKIIEIDPSKAKNNEEKKIYKEYLSGALSEVDNQLQKIIKLNKEVKQIKTLHDKTEEFLEQAEFSSDITSRSLTVTENKGTDDALVTSGREKNLYSQPQIKSFSLLLKQLNINREVPAEENGLYSLDSLRTNLSIDEYQELLNEIITKLSDYKLILSHKLDAYK